MDGLPGHMDALDTEKRDRLPGSGSWFLRTLGLRTIRMVALTSPASDDVSRGLAHLRTVGRVVVVGQGGIGKSRLVGQLTEALAPHEVLAVDAELVENLARVEAWLLDQAAIPALGGETATGTLASDAEGRRVAIVIDGPTRSSTRCSSCSRRSRSAPPGRGRSLPAVSTHCGRRHRSSVCIRCRSRMVRHARPPSVCSGRSSCFQVVPRRCSTRRPTLFSGSCTTRAASRSPSESPPPGGRGRAEPDQSAG